MTYDVFLARAIEDGIAAARRDYTRPDQADKLRGALDGFELCRDQTPAALTVLLAATSEILVRSRDSSPAMYWCAIARHAEVEWVCKVVSAFLVNVGQAPIAPLLYTARGVLKAAEILRG